MTQKFIVFLDRPYYPRVIGLYDSAADAKAAADLVEKDEGDPDGKNEATLYVCELVEARDLKTDY